MAPKKQSETKVPETVEVPVKSKSVKSDKVKDVVQPVVKVEEILVPSTKSSSTKKESTKEEEAVKETKIDNQKEIENEIGVVFKVQIAASTKKMDLEPSNFKNLKNIDIENTGSIYKYFYEQTSDYEQAKKFLAEAKSKGYNSAFIIAFKNRKSIPLKDAIK